MQEHTNWNKIARSVEQYNYQTFAEIFGDRYLFSEVVEFFRRYQIKSDKEFFAYVQERAAREMEREANLQVNLEQFMKDNYFLFEFAAFRGKITRAALTKAHDLKMCLKDQKVTDFIDKIGLETYQFVLKTDDPDSKRLRAILEQKVKQNQKILSQINCGNLNDTMLYCQQKRITFNEAILNGQTIIKQKLIGNNYDEFITENEDFVLAVCKTTDLVQLYDYCVNEHMKLEEIVIKVKWQVTEALGLQSLDKFEKILSRFKELLRTTVHLKLATEEQLKKPCKFLSLIQTLKIKDINEFINLAKSELSLAIGASGEELKQILKINKFLVKELFKKSQPLQTEIYWKMVAENAISLQNLVEREKTRRYNKLIRGEYKNLDEAKSEYKKITEFFKVELKSVRVDIPIRLVNYLKDQDLYDVLEKKEAQLLKQSMNCQQNITFQELRAQWLELYKSPLVQFEIDQPCEINNSLFKTLLIPHIRAVLELSKLPIREFIQRNRRNTWRILGFNDQNEEMLYKQFTIFVEKCEVILKEMQIFDVCSDLCTEYSDQKLINLAQQHHGLKKNVRMFMRQFCEQYKTLKAVDVRQVFVNVLDQGQVVKTFQNMDEKESFFQFAMKCDDNYLRKLIILLIEFTNQLQINPKQFEATVEKLYSQTALLNKQLQDLDGIQSVEYPIDSRLDMLVKRQQKYVLKKMTLLETIDYLLAAFNIDQIDELEVNAAIKCQDPVYIQKAFTLNNAINTFSKEEHDFANNYRRLIKCLSADPITYQLNNKEVLEKHFENNCIPGEDLKIRFMNNKCKKLSKSATLLAKQLKQQQIDDQIKEIVETSNMPQIPQMDSVVQMHQNQIDMYQEPEKSDVFHEIPVELKVKTEPQEAGKSRNSVNSDIRKSEHTNQFQTYMKDPSLPAKQVRFEEAPKQITAIPINQKLIGQDMLSGKDYEMLKKQADRGKQIPVIENDAEQGEENFELDDLDLKRTK
uniref:Uncharacterized protein n=1 Tax=Trepomonas sp. PC1 TaxID=1076344 RepID=A0A146K3D3_9EUKA|eukprot:JAP90405.1 Hypothetical protein TPC1_30100 [Trepomonas sp. PC1]